MAAMTAGMHAAPAPVGRGLQKRAGLLTASLVYGLALGGLFALAFAFVYGGSRRRHRVRLRTASPRPASAPNEA